MRIFHLEYSRLLNLSTYHIDLFIKRKHKWNIFLLFSWRWTKGFSDTVCIYFAFKKMKPVK